MPTDAGTPIPTASPQTFGIRFRSDADPERERAYWERRDREYRELVRADARRELRRLGVPPYGVDRSRS